MRRKRKFTGAPKSLAEGDRPCNRTTRGSSNTTSDGGIFDRMSEILDDHAKALDDMLRHCEAGYRRELIEAFRTHRDSCENNGRILFEYKRIFKPQRIWTKVATDLANLLGYDVRTLFRWVEEHELTTGTRAPRVSGKKPRRQSVAEPEVEAVLSLEQEQFLERRADLRTALAGITGERCIKVLRELIAYEAYESWGKTKPFQLEIVPGPCPIVIRHEDWSKPIRNHNSAVTHSEFPLHNVDEKHRSVLMPKVLEFPPAGAPNCT